MELTDNRVVVQCPSCNHAFVQEEHKLALIHIREVKDFSKLLTGDARAVYDRRITSLVFDTRTCDTCQRGWALEHMTAKLHDHPLQEGVASVEFLSARAEVTMQQLLVNHNALNEACDRLLEKMAKVFNYCVQHRLIDYGVYLPMSYMALAQLDSRQQAMLSTFVGVTASADQLNETFGAKIFTQEGELGHGLEEWNKVVIL